MSLQALENLVKIGQLKAEPKNDTEVRRLMSMAKTRLADAGLGSLSLDGRFISAYNAGHGASLAALRWHGYRSEHRFTVFQCLTHTIGWESSRWRVLDHAHRKRNLAEYEGYLDIDESFCAELLKLSADLIQDVEKLIRET